MGSGRIDLDLEFEDEEEKTHLENERAKAQEEIKDIDLHFAIQDVSEDDEITVDLKKAQDAPAAVNVDPTNPTMTNMTVPDLPESTGTHQLAALINSDKSSPAISLADYRLGDGLNAVVAQSELLNAELQAKLASTARQAKTEIIVRASQDAKLLEHKIVKLLTRIHAKAPNAKAELLAIKKALAEHAAVSRLLSEVSEPKKTATKKKSAA